MVGLAPKWVRLDPKLDKSGTLAPKWVRLDPTWDKSGAFSDQSSVHLARGRQMH